MNIFNKIKASFAPKVKPTVHLPKAWRTGMWVMYENRIGIIFKLGEACEIHFTDPESGDTIAIEQVHINGLRQARWIEIPAKRRGFTQEKALELGYGA
jgi:hypothetical protein